MQCFLLKYKIIGMGLAYTKRVGAYTSEYDILLCFSRPRSFLPSKQSVWNPIFKFRSILSKKLCGFQESVHKTMDTVSPKEYSCNIHVNNTVVSRARAHCKSTWRVYFQNALATFRQFFFLTKLKSNLYKSVWVEQDKFYIDLIFSFLTLDRYNFYLNIMTRS